MKFGPKLGEAYILVRNTGSASIYFNFYLNLFDAVRQKSQLKNNSIESFTFFLTNKSLNPNVFLWWVTVFLFSLPFPPLSHINILEASCFLTFLLIICSLIAKLLKKITAVSLNHQQFNLSILLNHSVLLHVYYTTIHSGQLKYWVTL